MLSKDKWCLEQTELMLAPLALLGQGDVKPLARKIFDEMKAEAVKIYGDIETERLPEASAAKKVRLSFPAFYWRLEHRADDKFQLGADDAKLPYVLKDRINRAVMGRVVDKQAVERASSFNALVRQLI